MGEGSVVVGDLWKEVGGMERTGGGGALCRWMEENHTKIDQR